MYCLERETGKGETVHVIVVHFMGMGAREISHCMLH